MIEYTDFDNCLIELVNITFTETLEISESALQSKVYLNTKENVQKLHTMFGEKYEHCKESEFYNVDDPFVVFSVHDGIYSVTRVDLLSVIKDEVESDVL